MKRDPCKFFAPIQDLLDASGQVLPVAECCNACRSRKGADRKRGRISQVPLPDPLRHDPIANPQSGKPERL